MNIDQGVLAVRDQLQDQLKQKFSDAELVRYFDEQSKVLYRIIFRSNREWSNIALHLKKADAKTIFKSCFEWTLPTWVERVVSVYERTDGADESGQSTYSSYLWTNPVTLDPSSMIAKTDSRRRDGWVWEGNHTLRLWNRPTAPMLTVFCQALPAPMFSGDISTPYADATGFYKPASAPFLGESYIEEGQYINGYVQVTNTFDPLSTNMGAVRRIIYSRANAIVTTTRQVEFRVEKPFDTLLASGDHVSTQLAIDEIHSRLLELMVVNACAVKHFNFDLQKSIAGELREAKADFISYAEAPRDHAGPGWYNSGRGVGRRSDIDTYRGRLWAMGT